MRRALRSPSTAVPPPALVPVLRAALLVPLLLAPAACTEDPITDVEPGNAPGAATATREVVAEIAELPSFRDTSYSGFAIPGNAGFAMVAATEELRARALGRFSGVGDSIEVPFDTLAVETFLEASVLIRLDTLRSEFPPFPFTLEMRSVEREWDPFQVEWERAADGVPWEAPGGDLGALMGEGVMEEATDSMVVEIDGVSVDSLLRRWAETGGEPGFALLMDAPGRLRIQQAQLRFSADVEERDEPVDDNNFVGPVAFIYDPEPPPPAGTLRVAGLPAWRFYVTFRLPGTVDDVPLREATVNHAQLVFRSLEAPADPFRPERAITLLPLELVADPFVLGPKTPIGSSTTTAIDLDPEILSLGDALEIDVTALVLQAISDAEESEGPLPEIRFGVRAQPDAQTLGFWEFGSAENPSPELRPELRLVLTPPADFEVP